MRLTILGSGSIQPNRERGGSALLVSHHNQHLLLDAGPGALQSLQACGVHTGQLCGVAVTHRHLDHCSELTYLLDIERSRNRTETFTLIGPRILDELVKFHLSWGRIQPAQLPYPLGRLVLPGIGDLDAFHIEGKPVPHVDHSVGLRITIEGRTLVYPGDCGPSEDVIKLTAGADLLILECSLPSQGKSSAHLSPEDAAEIAFQSRCHRLVLTHFGIDVDVEQAVEVCRKTGIPVDAAFDGAQFSW